MLAPPKQQVNKMQENTLLSLFLPVVKYSICIFFLYLL